MTTVVAAVWVLVVVGAAIGVRSALRGASVSTGAAVTLDQHYQAGPSPAPSPAERLSPSTAEAPANDSTIQRYAQTWVWYPGVAPPVQDVPVPGGGPAIVVNPANNVPCPLLSLATARSYVGRQAQGSYEVDGRTRTCRWGRPTSALDSVPYLYVVDAPGDGIDVRAFGGFEAAIRSHAAQGSVEPSGVARGAQVASAATQAMVLIPSTIDPRAPGRRFLVVIVRHANDTDGGARDRRLALRAAATIYPRWRSGVPAHVETWPWQR